MDTAPLRRCSRPSLGHSSVSTQNVFDHVFPYRPYMALIPSTAVILANVLGFFDPVRALIKTAIREGFIQPAKANLVKFVDGPSDHSLHGSFDWGKVLLEELDSWKGHPSYSLGFDWTRSREDGEKPETFGPWKAEVRFSATKNSTSPSTPECRRVPQTYYKAAL